MTITRYNKEEMESLVSLAESLGCHSVKFNVVQPIGRGVDLYKDDEALDIEEVVHIGHWVKNELSHKTSMKVFLHQPCAFQPLHSIFEMNCGILNILGVLSDGSYSLCGIGESIPELVFGNAATDDLKEIWENTSILRQLRDGLPNKLEGICKYCTLKSVCLGGCIAQNYFRSNSLWTSFWMCEAAFEKGLFPENRCIKTKKNQSRIKT
jgi:SynChlorMet cassette radical SAM/SPASM protein ScmF